MRKLIYRTKKRLKKWRWQVGRFEITWRGKSGNIKRSDPIHIGSTILYSVGPFAVFEYAKKR